MESQAAASVSTTETTRAAFTVLPGGSFTPSLVEGLRTDVDVPFTLMVECAGLECTVPLDVLAPSDGGLLPTMVLVPGGPMTFDSRRYLELLAAAVAHRGAVLFLITYRSSETGNPESDSLHDVRCAIRYARAATDEYGGDPERIIAVGRSLGSELLIEAFIRPEVETPGCLAARDGIPEAVVGMADSRPIPTTGLLEQDRPNFFLASATNDR